MGVQRFAGVNVPVAVCGVVRRAAIVESAHAEFGKPPSAIPGFSAPDECSSLSDRLLESLVTLGIYIYIYCSVAYGHGYPREMCVGTKLLPCRLPL